MEWHEAGARQDRPREGDADAAKLQIRRCHNVTEAVQGNFSVDVALSGEQGHECEINLLLADAPGF